MPLHSLYSYLLHLATGLGMVLVFMAIYLKVTPFDEIALIRKGCLAAALSMGGALVGFGLTVASSLSNCESYLQFAIWGGLSAVVQLVTYLVVAWLMPSMTRALEEDNRAMGAFLGLISLAVGIVNAACLT